MAGLFIFLAFVVAAVLGLRWAHISMRRWEAAEHVRAAAMYVPPASRQRGFVKSYDSETGLGVIEPTEGGEQVVLPVSSLAHAGVPKVLPGQHVEYAAVTKDGKTFAEDLTFPPAPKKDDCGCSK